MNSPRQKFGLIKTPAHFLKPMEGHGYDDVDIRNNLFGFVTGEQDIVQYAGQEFLSCILELMYQRFHNAIVMGNGCQGVEGETFSVAGRTTFVHLRSGIRSHVRAASNATGMADVGNSFFTIFTKIKFVRII